ncbi:hypothetical protein, partial [Thiolapillus sp.]|uniref:hypothetical protein n=1 Tax=Thiolapillus sp. TaxID=2017437 RepID=UPI0025F432E9
MTRTAGAQIGCQRPSRFWGLGCPKIYHEAEDTLDRLWRVSELYPGPVPGAARHSVTHERGYGNGFTGFEPFT